MNTLHVSEYLPDYVLGLLEEEEKEGVSKHLERCLRCQAELRAYHEVMGQIPQTIPQREPPLRLRAAIMQKAASQELSAHSSRPRLFTWLARPLSPLVGLVGLILIVAMASLNLVQLEQSRNLASASTAVAPAFHLVKLTSPQGTGPTGVLVISDDGDFGTLVVDGLALLDASQQYQLWLIKDGKRTSGGVFTVQDSGYGMLRVESPQPLIQYQSFGITIEPFGGSPGPTGKKVLGGSL